jgi:carboxyl-terminal processing protease
MHHISQIACHLTRRNTVLAFVFALFAVSLAGCGKGGALATETGAPSDTAIAQTSTPNATAAPDATATPDPAVLLKDGGIAIVRAAYDRLLDEYIDPVEPATLLEAAWSGASTQAATIGISSPPQPSFAGDRTTAFESFSASYAQLVARVADAKQIRYAALKSMAQTLNDCHTFFLTPVASDTIVDTRSGKGAVGIGIELAGVPPLVTEVIATGPADRAGVLVGDRIVSIDGSDATSFGPASAFDLINGNEGSTLRLQLRRSGQPSLIDVTMLRARVTPPNVESRIIRPPVGYLRIRNFTDDGVSSDVKAALASFESNAVTKWIIDLRDNPGGRLDVDAISLFVKSGVVVRDRGRGDKTEEWQATGAVLPLIRPIVLLTDNRTGSVAEAFVAALQEYGVAYVVGATSNGCVGFTDIQPLGDGSSLAVTTDVNLGPVTNKPLNGVGVVPDEPVARTSADIANGDDPQLAAAVAHLGG